MLIETQAYKKAVSSFNHFGRNSRGSILLESIVAVSILAVAGVMIIPGISKQFNTLKDIGQGERCEAYLMSSFAQIERQKIDKDQAAPFLKPDFHFNPKLPATAKFMTIPAKAAARFAKMGEASLYDQIINGKFDTLVLKNNGVTLKTPLLANNTMGYLADLYADGVKNAPVPLPPEIKPTFNVPTEKFDGKIAIRLYELDSGQYPTSPSPGEKFWPRPRNQFEKSEIGHPNLVAVDGSNALVIAKFPDYMHDDMGFEVRLEGVLTDGSGNPIENCNLARRFKYDMDFHNVLDFYSDFNLIRYTGSEVKDNTFSLSNKQLLGNSIPDKFKPIFTNINPEDPAKYGREREKCSQKGEPLPSIYLSLKVYSPEREPGVLPMCLDTSTQWLSKEGTEWCPATNVQVGSRTGINYDWKPLDRGWVPCEKLTFCNQPPDRVETRSDMDPVTKKPFVEYRYHYENIKADDNLGPGGNRLWGCELKYMVSAVDSSGNLSYSPLSQFKPSGTDPQLLLDVIREVNPKIYFKPPPCYTCTCKPCKKGKGGFLGGFFKILVLIVLTIVTAGSYWAIGFMTFTSGFLTAVTLACAAGTFCEKDGKSIPANLSSAGKFRGCDENANNGCKCGSKCTLRRVPAPSWTDVLVDGADPSKADELLKSNSCKPEKRTVVRDGVQFDVMLAYRSRDADTGELKYVENENVLNLDEITWLEFRRAQGKFCIANFQCVNGKWVEGAEFFEDPKGSGTPKYEKMVGCFDVKIGHGMKWAAPETKMVTKPKLGDPRCLEVNFNRGPFNPGGENLKGFKDLTAECGQVADTSYVNYFGYGSTGVTFNTEPYRRLVGTATNACVSATDTVEFEGKNILLAAPALLSYGGYDDSSYQCWSGCTPPGNMPQGPQGAPVGYKGGVDSAQYEQLYYEAYNPKFASSLPFCTMEREDFNVDK